MPVVLDPKPRHLHPVVVRLTLPTQLATHDHRQPPDRTAANRCQQQPDLRREVHHAHAIGRMNPRLDPSVQSPVNFPIRLALLLLLAAPALSHSQTLRVEGRAAGQIELSIRHFGVGGNAREGEWAGILLGFTDHGTNPRSLMFSIPQMDLDGDTGVHYRVVASNPGLAQTVWLYYRIPFGVAARTDFRIELHEAIDAPAGAAATHTRGELLLTASGTMPPVHPAASAFLGVVGAYDMGLGRYADSMHHTQSFDYGGHEGLYPVRSLTPQLMPDRWYGLRQYDAIVWGQGRPTELNAESGRAIREWVIRGGHLVVVLPPIGQDWLADDLYNPLADILPRVRTTRREGASLEPYRWLLQDFTTGPTARRTLPPEAVIHTFEPLPDALPHEAVRIMNGNDGSCVVVSRHFGLGAVTLVGLDLNQTALRAQNLPDAPAFWHRVLGRRGQIVDDQVRADPRVNINLSRTPRAYDGNISGVINQTGQAIQGVMLGFVLFTAYWAVAGPVSFAILKRTGQARHAWLAFVGSAALFTGIAWGGASLIRPSRVDAQHVTLMEHVFGQPYQRARTFASILLPDYGDEVVSIGPPGAESAGGFSNILTAWEPPGTSTIGQSQFPDTRDYLVNSADPDTIAYPTRATVKLVQADWAGPPIPNWEMPFPIDEGGTPGVIRLTRVGAGAGARYELSGTLQHNLPGPLQDVLIVCVFGQRDHRTRGIADGGLIASGLAWKLNAPWRPNQPLDLGTLTDETGLESASSLDEYLESAIIGSTAFVSGVDRSVDIRRLTDSQFIWNMPVPKGGTFAGPYSTAALREVTHGWDAGRWLTQPCIMIIGHLADDRDQPCPTPLFVDGRRVPTRGRTVVRWIYALPENPPGHGSETAVEEPGPEGG